MNQSVPIDVVVPVHNRPEVIQAFIRQMRSQSYKEFRLVIVDHGTEPVDLSACDDERIHVLRESPELWWTGAVNRGIEWTLDQEPRSDFILVINDDARFEDGYLQSMADAALTHPDAIVGSVCCNKDTGRLMYAGCYLDRWRARFVPKHAGRRLDEVLDEDIPSDVLPGRGMLVPVAVFHRIGLFDERHLPHYGADNELSWRAKRWGIALLAAKSCVVGTACKTPPRVQSSTTSKGFICDKKKPGNLPAVAAFAFLCFSGPYASYYTAVNFLRLCLSYAKRSLIGLCRREDV